MKKLFTILLMSMFLISFASAFDFDNTYEYNPTTKTAYIHNCDFWLGTCFSQGEVLAEATLLWGDTQVARGIDQHVGTFSYTPKSENAEIQDLDLINLKNGQVMTRGKQYKVLEYYNETVDEYETVCESYTYDEYLGYDIGNNCEEVEIGSHIELKSEWTPISNPNFEFTVGETYTIGVFVDVVKGDYGDWLPTFSGVQVNEWAYFNETSLAGLSLYYKLDNSTGGVHDEQGNFTGTNNDATRGVTGILNNAFTFDGTNDFVDPNAGYNTRANVETISLWFKTSTDQVDRRLYGTWDGSSARGIRLQSDQILLDRYWSGSAKNAEYNVDYSDDTWHHVVYVENTSGAFLFYDGQLRDKNANTNDYSGVNYDYFLGARSGSGTEEKFYIGTMDEVGIWTRSLSPDEITELWNSGNALAYPFFNPDSPPTITGLAPANNTNFTTQNIININATIYDDVNLANVTFNIDGVNESTNTSGLNNTLYNYQKLFSNGEHNFTIYATDNVSQVTASDTHYINVDIPTPEITLLDPDDNQYIDTSTYEFSSYIVSSRAITSVSIYLDSVLNETDTSGNNASVYQFEKTFTDGVHTWFMRACNDLGFCADSSVRTFTIDTINPNITANLTTPIIYNFGDNVSVDLNITDTNLDTCWYEYTNTTENIFSCTSGVEQEINISSIAGYTNITFYVNDSAGRESSEVVSFDFDSVAPTVEVTSPETEITELLTLGDNLYLNSTATDSDNLDTCWYEYNNINTTIDGCVSGVQNSTAFATVGGEQTITFYANDTLGNINSTSVSWTYFFLEGETSYDEYAYETQSDTFTFNLTTDLDILTVSGVLNYDGESYVSDASCEGSICTLTNTLDLPLVTSGESENRTFNFTTTLFDGDTSYTITSANREQNVTKIYLQHCGTGDEALDFTAAREDNLTAVNPFYFGGQFDYWLGSGDVKKSYNYEEASAANVDLCISEDETFYIDGLISYDGTDTTFVERTYLFDNYSINNVSQGITLLLLEATESTTFIQEVLQNKVGVEGAIIYTYRYYAGDDSWNITQITETDSDGKTVGFYESETALYKHIITVNGVTRVNETEGRKMIPESVPYTITWNLDSPIDAPWEVFDDELGLSKSLSWNEDTEIVTYTYTGNSSFSNGNLTVYKENYASADELVCQNNNSLSAASITCNLTGEEGNFIAYAYVDRGGETLFVDSIRFDNDTGKETFGRNGVLLGWFLLLVAGCAFFIHPIIGIVALNITMILINMIGLVSFGWIWVFGVMAISGVLIWLMKD